MICPSYAQTFTCTMPLPFLLTVFLICTTVWTPSSASEHLSSEPEYIKLKSVHLVFRHGDSVRVTPEFYMKDPKHIHADFNPHVHSDLTNEGRLRSYRLGQFLRWHYRHFLDKEYRREDVYARSTYLERARASLHLVLAGLYPPEGHQKWHSNLDWQPISIESTEGEDDPLMWSIRCPRYLDERKIHERKSKFLDKIQNLVNFFVMFENYTNPEYKFSTSVTTDLFTKLKVGIDADVSITDWSPDVFSNVTGDLVRDAVFLRYETQNYNKKLIRLNGGILMKKIIDDMKDVIEGKPMPKINLYAGHEFNVVALLYALGAWREVGPTYLSFVAVELWEINAEHYIRVLYRDGRTHEFKDRRIKKCSHRDTHRFCPFEEFVTLREKYMPTNSSECYDAPEDVEDEEDSSIEVEGKTDSENDYRDYC